MARRKNNANEINDLAYQTIENRWKLKAMGRFTWENLPDDNEERRIEKYLYDFGRCAFLWDPQYGYLILQASVLNQADLYARPTECECTGFGRTFHRFIYWGEEAYKTARDVNGRNVFDPSNTCVLIENNAMGTSVKSQISYKVWQLFNVERMIDVNVQQIGMANIIKSSSTDRGNVNELFNRIRNYEPYNGLYSEEMIQQLSLLEMNVQFYGNDLQSLKKSLESDLDIILGLNNVGTEKRERLITSEVEANDETIESEFESARRQRQYGIDLTNGFFGLDISLVSNVHREAESAENPEGERSETYEKTI